MNKSATVLTITILLLISTISASCDKDQIDINTASAEKLQNIIQIGPVRADEIIKLRAKRLFESVDDLVRVWGIVAGGSRLTQIKEQELACVNGQEEEVEEEAEKKEEINEEHQEIEELQEIKEPVSRETEPIELQTINLNPALHEI